MHINKDKLVSMAVNANVDHPTIRSYRGGFDGRARITLGTGGITYSHAIGDNCMDLAGDHVEPGVSMANPDSGQNAAVQTFSCVGNVVTCLSGPAAGAQGFVTGTHGGVEHAMGWFAKEDLEKMQGDERFMIRTCGQGMKVEETPDVFWINLDPDLLEVMDLKIDEEGKLVFPVVTILPPYMMGSGLGSSSLMSGDYDIMTQDKEANEKFGLNNLRFGDFVAVLDHDSTYGAHYKDGSVTIGVVVHSDSFTSGHGPGLTVVATSENGAIKPVVDEEANLRRYFGPLAQRKGL
ncbi:DUF4438 domain-containing protein [Allobaculum mucilyticum]|uniref:DUF4438 family protein n=1 Tax=Allobaculum mucilyticum TaxID=2834459 RepID=UPI001E558C94|nr:DUF4438 domain-containing protein [Allobaculum mucilyticum]UNT96150.1 DUF4438 domain-containing protein [Allobaculum mucilyticum]